MTLTKAEMIDNLVEKSGLSKNEAREFIEAFFEEIRLCLETGEEVKLSGFGTFSVREKKARPGRNPKTGENASISARRVVSFKSGQKLRERVESVNIIK